MASPNAVLDSGGLTLLATRSARSLAVAVLLERRGHWPPVISTMTMVEALQGRPGPDAPTNQFLKACRIESVVSEKLARRAARLRTSAGRGSAVDALIVALAEPGGSSSPATAATSAHWPSGQTASLWR